MPFLGSHRLPPREFSDLSRKIKEYGEDPLATYEMYRFAHSAYRDLRTGRFTNEKGALEVLTEQLSSLEEQAKVLNLRPETLEELKLIKEYKRRHGVKAMHRKTTQQILDEIKKERCGEC